jgi:hypothetical protein
MTMHDFLDFFSKWLHAIGEVFGKYPLAGAIITIGAVALFLWAMKEYKVADWTKRALLLTCVLIAWLVCVPLLGLVLDLLGEVWTLIKLLYGQYYDQPFFVLVVTGVAIVAGSIWVFLPLLRSHRPGRWVRVIVIVLAWLATTLLGVPIMNKLYPPPKHEEAKTDHH